MPERLREIFELKITLGNLLTLFILLATGYAGYVELRTNHANLAARQAGHEAYDDKRFEAFSTKEAREMRDRWVDDKLNEILRRVQNIEAAHVKK